MFYMDQTVFRCKQCSHWTSRWECISEATVVKVAMSKNELQLQQIVARSSMLKLNMNTLKQCSVFLKIHKNNKKIHLKSCIYYLLVDSQIFFCRKSIILHPSYIFVNGTVSYLWAAFNRHSFFHHKRKIYPLSCLES